MALSYEELEHAPQGSGPGRLLRVDFMGNTLEAHLFTGGVIHTATLWFTSTCCAWRPSKVRNNWSFIRPGESLFCGQCKTTTQLRSLDVLHKPTWINTLWCGDEPHYASGLSGADDARDWLDSWGAEFSHNPLELRVEAEYLFNGLEEELRKFPLPSRKPGEAW